MNFIFIIINAIFLFQFIDFMPHDFHQCLYLTSFVVFIYAVSMASVVAVSIDRFWAISFPISYRENKLRRNVTIGIISTYWIVPFYLALLPIFDENVKIRFRGKCLFTDILSQNLMLLHATNLSIGCAVMIVMYCVIFFKIAKQVRQEESYLLRKYISKKYF